MRAFLHIGTEKTGTTSIQRMLEQNRDVLRANGYDLLDFRGCGSNRHLAACCVGQGRDDDFFDYMGVDSKKERERTKSLLADSIREEIRGRCTGAHTLIISSEHLHSRLITPREVTFLRGLFAPACDEFTVLVYLRPQVDVAQSLLSTALKCGRPATVDEVVMQECRADSLYYDYARLLARWASVFGREAMRVHLYDSAEFHEGDLLADFVQQLDPRLWPLMDRDVPRLNVDLGTFEQSLLRAVCACVPRVLPGRGLNPLHERICARICRDPGPAARHLDAEGAKAVQERFAESNELVRREYFPQRRELFAISGGGQPSFSLTPSQEQMLCEVLATVAGAMRP